jgi:hypothetical protein
MNTKPESEIIVEDEINLYDYWKVVVKRKKILIGIFLVPLIILTIISFSMPRYYRGEAEISDPVFPSPPSLTIFPVFPASPASPASQIVKLIGTINDTKKFEIFTNNSDAIKSVFISLSKKVPNQVSIIVDAKTADVIPQAFKKIFYYGRYCKNKRSNRL